MKNTRIILSAVSLTFFGVFDTLATTINVPTDQLTIQAGIDSASSGDTVLVAPGTYTGDGNRDMSFNSKAIVVMSSTGPETSIIDCEGDSANSSSYHRAFSFIDGEDSTSVLSGFTIQNGVNERGGAILIISSSPTINGCIIIKNSAVCSLENCSGWLYTGGSGGAIYISLGSPRIQECTFSGNSASQSGGGLCADYLSSCDTPPCPTIPDFAPIIESCVFVDNFVGFSEEILPGIIRRSGRGGGAYLSIQGPITISNCLFSDNNCLGQGGGGLYVAAEHLDMKYCLLQNNSASWGSGGGMLSYVRSGQRPKESQLIACRFLNNSAGNFGGGLRHSFDEILVDSCLFDGNAAVYGGAIHGDQTDGGFWGLHASVQNSTFVNNFADSGGAAIHYWSPFPGYVHNSIIAYNHNSVAIGADSGDFTCTNIFGNEGGDWVGGIANQADSNGNFSADPLFCDAPNGDYHLKEISPCAPTNNSCGELIGALGVECLASDVVENDVSNLPAEFTLEQNYPNPFNPSTIISYSLPSKSDVTISIFNILGQQIKIIEEGVRSAGSHSITWDGRNDASKPVASGVYFYRVTAGENTLSKKMLLLK